MLLKLLPRRSHILLIKLFLKKQNLRKTLAVLVLDYLNLPNGLSVPETIPDSAIINLVSYFQELRSGHKQQMPE